MPPNSFWLNKTFKCIFSCRHISTYSYSRVDDFILIFSGPQGRQVRGLIYFDYFDFSHAVLPRPQVWWFWRLPIFLSSSTRPSFDPAGSIAKSPYSPHQHQRPGCHFRVYLGGLRTNWVVKGLARRFRTLSRVVAAKNNPDQTGKLFKFRTYINIYKILFCVRARNHYRNTLINSLFVLGDKEAVGKGGALTGSFGWTARSTDVSGKADLQWIGWQCQCGFWWGDGSSKWFDGLE